MQPLRQPADADRFPLFVDRHDSPLGRWTLVAAAPQGLLGELVEVVWTSRGEGVFTQEEILPRTPTEVLFALGETHWLRDRQTPSRDRAYTRAFVSGLQTRPLWVESPADSEMAGIRLRPLGAAAFLRSSPSAIAESVVDLDLLLGRGVESLRDQLAGEPDLTRRTLRLAAAVEDHLLSTHTRLPAPAIRDALAQLQRSAGRVSIGRLVERSGFSHRHFAARFEAEIGVAPKTFARIARFEAAFAALQTPRHVGDGRAGWADFALQFGFYDQSHLIREFHELAGATPADVVRRLAPDGLGLLADEQNAQIAPIAHEPA